jgi:hypothetical protein
MKTESNCGRSDEKTFQPHRQREDGENYNEELRNYHSLPNIVATYHDDVSKEDVTDEIRSARWVYDK